MTKIVPRKLEIVATGPTYSPNTIPWHPKWAKHSHGMTKIVPRKLKVVATGPTDSRSASPKRTPNDQGLGAAWIP